MDFILNFEQLLEIKRSSGMRRIDYITPKNIENINIEEVKLNPMTDLQELKTKYNVKKKTKDLFTSEKDLYETLQKISYKYRINGKHVSFIKFNNAYYFLKKPNGELVPIKPLEFMDI